MGAGGPSGDVALADLAPGTSVAGRYRLDRRTSATRVPGTTTRASAWVARDTVLDRQVDLLVVGGAATDDVLDAARRAAVVDDPRLLRVLDVGATDPPDGPLAHVVTESVPGETLGALVRRTGPLPPALVRTLVGEAAQALERSRASGLHHLRLTPEHLVRARDGGVKIAGVEVHAAVDDTASGAGDADGGARADAVGLVALAYAGLTGRWPDTGVPVSDDRLPAAPRGADGLVAPGDLVDGVDPDLDTLCVVTLGSPGGLPGEGSTDRPGSSPQDGPRTPGELAEQLAPWESPYADGREGGGTSAGAGAWRPVRPRRPVPPAPATPTAATPTSAPAPEAAHTSATGTDVPATTGGGGSGAGAVGTGAVGAGAVGAGAVGAVRDVDDTAGGPGAGPRDEDPGLWAAGPGDRAADDVAGGAAEDHRASTGDGAGGAAGGGGGPVPPPRTGGGDRSGGPSRQGWVIIALLAVAVVAALVVAVDTLAGIGQGGGGTAAPAPVSSTPAPAPEPTATPTPTPPPTPTPTPEAEPEVEPEVVDVTSLDPEGDGEESEDDVDLAVDGDSSTAWETSTYSSAGFGNLKSGLGYAVDLGSPTQVGGVVLSVQGTGGEVEVRTSSGPELDGSTVVASSGLDDGDVDIALAEPVETQHLVLWFTELPESDDGYRVVLSGVQVR